MGPIQPGDDPDRDGLRPALRASDADRERVVEVLRRAGDDGRLDVDELDQRVSAAYATRTLSELEQLTVDLVRATGAPLATPTGSAMPVRHGAGGTRRVVSIMSGHNRRGRWRVAARCLVLSIMGGADLDFHRAELAADTTRIHVVSLMGGAELKFPHGVDVQVSKFALMGGHEVTLDDESPPPGAPVVHVRLLSIMGGAKVRQGGRPGGERDREAR